MLRNNLQGNDDLSCSPSRSSKSLTCLRVPWLLKSLSFDQPAQATVIYVSHSVALMQSQEIKINNSVWERSGSILECLTRDQSKRLLVRASPASLFCVLEQDINPCLVLVQPRTTRPDITEKCSLGHNESNQSIKVRVVYS